MTLRSWVIGRSYTVKSGQERRWWEGLIERPDPEDSRLSFSNLVEAYVLNVLRKQYQVKMPEVRTALLQASEYYGIPRFLLSEKLRVTHGNVFLDDLGKLINVGKGGQEGMPEILSAYLERIEYPRGFAETLAPLTRDDPKEAPRIILIDPKVAFGRPTVKSKGIRTAAISERFQVGESVDEIAEDYDLSQGEVEEAIRYERVVLAA